MLISYLKIALRSLLKNKVFSVIAIAGLAIGLTGFILIGIYVRRGLKPVYFILAVGVVILISWFTILFQMIRASQVNPAVVLKSE